MYLIFDTETTGLPRNWNAPVTDVDNWPRCVQIAWQLHDEWGELIEHVDYLIQPDGFTIPYDAEQIHGISTELAQEQGKPLSEVLDHFNNALEKSKFVVGQNIGFDLNIMGCEFHRLSVASNMLDLPVLDTCTEKTALLCQIPGGRGGKFKLPTLTELHEKLFGQAFEEAHNATADVEATTRCFLELLRRGNFSTKELHAPDDYLREFKQKNEETFQPVGLKHMNLKKESATLKAKRSRKGTSDVSSSHVDLSSVPFAHLHNHSQYSILQSTSDVGALVKAAVDDNMPAIALTDSGNMMGAFVFVKEVLKYKKDGELPIKPIVGCEFFVCHDHTDKKVKDNGYQVVLLAKNKRGYHNLAKMASTAYIDGFYYVPRIDKEVIRKYKEDVIVLSGGVNGEIPNKILNVGEHQAKEAVQWWKKEFGEDFYIELIDHGQENEQHINDVLCRFADEHQVKVVATNNTFYIKKEDSVAHDILLCVKDGEKIATPKGRGRGFRYGLPNDEYYFKSQEEMKALFADRPDAITTVQEIIDKVEVFELARDVLLPKFDMPPQFYDPLDEEDGGKRGENAYLRHLTYEGARERYDTITDEIKERLDFELEIIEKTGYPGYFLIVEDFIKEARRMGVSVGPGRGSAAGSAVAYCLTITNIDPIKYDLLFERFLNPDRVSLPDIDIDFDDEGRQRVIDYVIDKYGANQVAQIITYGTMAAKSSIRDTARVLDLPLPDADKIAKLIPGLKLNHIFGEDDKSKSKVKGLRAEEKTQVEELRSMAEGNGLESETINQARMLEGSVRNTGTHACGVIITPEDITNLIPVATAKGTDMYVTQFDNGVVEDAGLLKMDFLGLKTLTLIKDTVKIVKALHGVDLVPDDFPLDDLKTYELFQRGETIGIFQYESPGMQKHMKSLKPTEFADLIAMNALYRPGPMEYIPSFIDRKHGREEIEYDLPDMEGYLKETYGITVYQEQVMLLSQKLADFTKGQADMLRKAMGKKIFALLEKLKPLFIDGGKKNGHPEKTLEKIWKDWEAFAAYAFNKSHSTCYAYIAYQTAYLKAHYPAEYMASVLSNNMNDIKQVSFFMEECKRAGIPVLGPDINESYYKFSVNKDGAIRFGMGAIRGVGEGAVRALVDERKENGAYSSVFDVTKRVDLRAANKKAFDGLVLAGAFDSFEGICRSQYYVQDEKGSTFLEKSIRYGNKYQESKNSAQVSLFGAASEVQFDEPPMPICDPWPIMEKLSKEKEMIGIYISGHPLDDFKTEMKYFCNGTLDILKQIDQLEGREISYAGIITDVQHRFTKNGKPWGIFTLEDYSDAYEFKLFNEDYLKFRHYLIQNTFIYIKTTYRRGWQQGDVRVQINAIQQLQDVMEKMAKKITIQLPIEGIDEKVVNSIEAVFTRHKGNQVLNFVIYDREEKLKLTMPSRSSKVEITKELIDELNENEWSFKLN